METSAGSLGLPLRQRRQDRGVSIALGASTLLAALTVLMGAPVGRLELRISPREAGAMLVLDTITVTGGEESSAVRLVVPARAGY